LTAIKKLFKKLLNNFSILFSFQGVEKALLFAQSILFSVYIQNLKANLLIFACLFLKQLITKTKMNSSFLTENIKAPINVFLYVCLERFVFRF